MSDGLEYEQLETLLFPPVPGLPADRRHVLDWAWMRRELLRPDVTMALMWEECSAGAPDGFGYFWFCGLYREWAGKLRCQSALNSFQATGEPTPRGALWSGPR